TSGEGDHGHPVRGHGTRAPRRRRSDSGPRPRVPSLGTLRGMAETAAAAAKPSTYLLVDGENIDATLGMSVLGRRPNPEERPRWDRVRAFASDVWDHDARGLFFLNATNGQMPMSFVQALLAMDFQPIPLAGASQEKVVDIGIQRTMQAILDQCYGDVLLATHDGDYIPQLE